MADVLKHELNHGGVVICAVEVCQRSMMERIQHLLELAVLKSAVGITFLPLAMRLLLLDKVDEVIRNA